jgi:hypothetical protein
MDDPEKHNYSVNQRLLIEAMKYVKSVNQFETMAALKLKRNAKEILGEGAEDAFFFNEKMKAICERALELVERGGDVSDEEETEEGEEMMKFVEKDKLFDPKKN